MAVRVLNAKTHRFCQIAVDMGYISDEQLREALAVQIANEPSTRLRPHRRVGEIMLEKGWMTNKQIQTVLMILNRP